MQPSHHELIFNPLNFPNYPSHPIALTNGCFDLFHAGHAHSFKTMRNILNKLNPQKVSTPLYVAVNSDASIQKLKGPSRPIIPQIQRITTIRALRHVNRAFLFDSTDICEILQTLKPAVWFKPGYTHNQLNPDEVKIAKEIHCTIICPISHFPKLSSSSIIQKILANHIQTILQKTRTAHTL
jgi:cytidyltransferase-like protein